MPSNGVNKVQMIWSLTYYWGCNEWRNMTHADIEVDPNGNQAERDITILEEGMSRREH